MQNEIDMTPTWEEVGPLLFAALREGTPQGSQIAREELLRALRMADKWIAQSAAK